MGDNMAAVLSSDRGRAAAYALLSRLRTASAFMLACDITPHDRWLQSERNPTDALSRAFAAYTSPYLSHKDMVPYLANGQCTVEPFGLKNEGSLFPG